MVLTALRTASSLRLLLGAVLIAGITSCDKKKPIDEPEEPAAFDKQGMLVNFADAVVLPAYTTFGSSLDTLIKTYQTFTASGSLSAFQAVKAAFIVSYKNYQHISPLEFGPGETAGVQMNFNVFPTDTPQIKNNIANGSYDLSVAANLDAKGFPAIDFLLYGSNRPEQEMHQLLVTDQSRRKYLNDLLADMKTRIATVISGWSGYRGDFVNSLGTDIGSSIGFLVNRINFELDYLKNSKIGIPLGKKTLGQPLPGHCEGVYSTVSLDLALETLTAIENLYRGSSKAGSNGPGFDDYLDHLGANHVNGPLTAAIDNQFSVARLKLQAVPSPLSSQVTGNAPVVDAAYVELVKLLVLLKTDMPSALGVVITYQDGDGD
jgi:uncharacterized protein